jgi:hypothetical protein
MNTGTPKARKHLDGWMIRRPIPSLRPRALKDGPEAWILSRRSFLVGAGATIGWSVLAGGWPCRAEKQEDKEKALRLFDGKTLDGWEGNLAYWSVQDGMIVGKHEGLDHNEFLCTTRTFKNFELKLEFRLVGGKGNSGVQFRSRRVPNSSEVSGYQADIGENYWGALYDESRRNRILATPEGEARAALQKVLRKDGWNTYVIRAVGPRILLEINGVRTVDYTEKDPHIPMEGVIGLQIHAGAPMEVHFRNLNLRER